MNRISIMLMSLVFASLLSHGQADYQIKQAIDFFNYVKRQKGELASDRIKSDIQGSPYLNDEFIKGSVFTKSKTEFAGVPLRYNIYSDDIEFMSGEDVIKALVAPEMIEKIEFGDYKIMFLPYIIVKKIKKGYFIAMEEGNSSLFAKPKVIFQKAKKAGAYVDAEPAKFIKKPDEYYIRVGMEAARAITNKSDLYDVFPDHKHEIKSFIKENKVKPYKSEKLKKLVQYYNSL